MDVMLFEKTTRRSSSLPEYMYTSFLLFNSEMFSEIIPILRVYADARVFSFCNYFIMQCFEGECEFRLRLLIKV